MTFSSHFPVNETHRTGRLPHGLSTLSALQFVKQDEYLGEKHSKPLTDNLVAQGI
jgi:hypothetical protein